MNYKLIDGSLNDETNVIETVLKNRGIKNTKRFLNPDKTDTYPYALLKNIDLAVKCTIKHIQNHDKIHILVDCDVDGYVSGGMIYRALIKIDPTLNITYSLHTKKQHGLSNEIIIPEDCQLLFIPDAGSNDVEQCRKLKEKGIDIIILDHHICDEKNDAAIVINNQLCDYPNKNLCGAGIVYKFLEALDDELWENTAEDLIDVCALANISDVMDMREVETRYYVTKGLAHIRSKLFKALIEKQAYSMNNVVNIISVQFYITPILNAMIRIGDQDDKDLLFRAFIETDEVFKYKKRGEPEEVDENIYDRAARLCSNAKTRQTKEVTKEVAEVDALIERNKLYKNKALFVNVSDILGETLTGLVAIKIAEKYKENMAIKTPSLNQLVKNLSGGNQQKVILGRWMAADSELIIFDEPTRGIDVGAKYEIYKLMNDLVENQGKTILMISSEMEELMGMSDRIVVLSEGNMTGELSKKEFTQEVIMTYASAARDK